MNKLNRKITEGYTYWGKTGQFNDYVRKTSSPYLGLDQFHPITITDIIGEGRYCIVVRGTSSSEKITNTLKIGKKTIWYNNYDTYLFSTDLIIKQIDRFIGYADINSESYVKLKRNAKRKGQHKELIREMLTKIKEKNYDAVDEMIEKQLYTPTTEEIKHKLIYRKARNYSSRIEREKYLIRNGIDLNRYSHKKSKTALNKTVLDDEPAQ